MSAMPPLRSILNDTPANAIDVDWDFQTIEDYVANDVIKRDGSTAMEAPLNLLGPAPSQPSHAVTKGYIDAQVIPVGTIWQFAGATAPGGWVLCDGTSKSTTDPLYAALFAVIQYAFGGSGGNFNLPNLGGRVPVGRTAGDALFGTLGQAGGSRDLVLPSHVHAVASHNHAQADHVHALPAHQHNMQHMHDLQNHQHTSPLRRGFDINNANAPGQTNAIYPAQGNAPLIFTTRPTAQTEDAGGAPQFNVATPNVNNTGWIMNGPGGSNGLTDPQGAQNSLGMAAVNTGFGGGGDTDSRGVSPANANVQPYVTINFIIRIG